MLLRMFYHWFEKCEGEFSKQKFERAVLCKTNSIVLPRNILSMNGTNLVQ